MTLQHVYEYLRRGEEAETDRTLLMGLTLLHAQSGKPVTLTAIARDMLAMGIPAKRRAPRALIEAARRLAERDALVITEATHAPRKPLTITPTRPAKRVAHQVRASVTLTGNAPFIHCETCATTLMQEINEEFEHWKKRKAAFRKRHPAEAAGG